MCSFIPSIPESPDTPLHSELLYSGRQKFIQKVLDVLLLHINSTSCPFGLSNLGNAIDLPAHMIPEETQQDPFAVFLKNSAAQPQEQVPTRVGEGRLISGQCAPRSMGYPTNRVLDRHMHVTPLIGLPCSSRCASYFGQTTHLDKEGTGCSQVRGSGRIMLMHLADGPHSSGQSIHLICASRCDSCITPRYKRD
jgi:hypothetical protein